MELHIRQPARGGSFGWLPPSFAVLPPVGGRLGEGTRSSAESCAFESPVTLSIDAETAGVTKLLLLADESCTFCAVDDDSTVGDTIEFLLEGVFRLITTSTVCVSGFGPRRLGGCGATVVSIGSLVGRDT